MTKYKFPNFAYQGMKWSKIAIAAFLVLSFLGLLVFGKLD